MQTIHRRRATACCRVSTAQEAQEGSFKWQKRCYTELLSRDPALELVEVYGDEGCSGRCAAGRPGITKGQHWHNSKWKQFIVVHRGDQKLFWDQSNWQGLCAHHHNVKTGREDSRPTYSY